MYNGLRILAVVPARGGSKGVKLKNIRPLAGKPLLAYTAEVVAQLDYVDRAIVSTDHETIRAVAEDHGLTVPFMRPAHLAGDIVADWDVLDHALQAMEQVDGCRYDAVLMLQPTCPFRRPEHVTATLEKMVAGRYDAVWTVSPTDSKAHPLKQYVIVDDRLDHYLAEGAAIIARQQLPPVYHRNGAAYAISRECLVDQRSIRGDRCGAVVIEEPLVNIDTAMDIAFAEFLMSRQAGSGPPP